MIIEQNPIIMIDITALQTEVPKHQLSLAEPLTDEGGAPRLGKDYEIEKQYELCVLEFCSVGRQPIPTLTAQCMVLARRVSGKLLGRGTSLKS